MVLRRALQGLKVHAENVAPTENRGAKRVRGEDGAPASKRAGNVGLKVHSENIAVPQKKVLREQNNQIADPVKPQKDALKEITKKNNVAENQPEPAETSCKRSPVKKTVRAGPKCKNVMGDYQMVSALDFYLDKPDLPENVPDIDRRVLHDPTCEGHYAHDSFVYLHKREEQFICQPYLHMQPEVPTSYRALLVDWMVEIQESFELNHETLYLAVKMVDRFLSKKHLKRAQIQLLGATSLLIASKIDERVPPSLDEFTYICDDAYTREMFIDMERHILQVLEFDLSMPLSYSFLRRYCRSMDMNLREMTLARFILECSLMEYSMIVHRDSEIAAASLLLAMDILNIEWTDTLTYYTGYRPTELMSLRNDLNRLVHRLKQSQREEKMPTKTIFIKYSHEVFHQVASYEFPPIE